MGLSGEEDSARERASGSQWRERQCVTTLITHPPSTFLYLHTVSSTHSNSCSCSPCFACKKSLHHIRSEWKEWLSCNFESSIIHFRIIYLFLLLHTQVVVALRGSQGRISRTNKGDCLWQAESTLLTLPQ